MLSLEARQAAKLALLEGAIAGLMRDADEIGVDGLTINVEADAGQIVIDLTYTSKGMPVSGESL